MLLFNSASVMLNFSWIVLQMLLRCCLIHVIIIILRPILYLVYFYPYLGLGLFMSYLRDLVFIFSLIFIAINHVKSLKQTHLLLVHFFRISPIPADTDVFKASSGRLKKFTASYDQTRRGHDVWKKRSDLRRLEDVQFLTFWKRLI